MHYLTVVYEVDGATTAREILDSHPWTASSYSHAIHDRDAARYEIDSLQRYDQQTAPDFDVHTTAGGRGYVAWFFSNVLHRYDFADYINHALAADFACVLAKWLSTAPGRLVLDVPIISEGDMPVQAVRAAPQPATQTGEYPPLLCDYCGADTPDPWHSSGILHGQMSKHIHRCDTCAAPSGPEREPLTDEQIDALLVAHGRGDDGFHSFARAIEDEVLRQDAAQNRGRSEPTPEFNQPADCGLFCEYTS